MPGAEEFDRRCVLEKTEHGQVAALGVLTKAGLCQSQSFAASAKRRSYQDGISAKKGGRGLVIKHHGAFRVTGDGDDAKTPLPGPFFENFVDLAEGGCVIFVSAEESFVKSLPISGARGCELFS